MSASARAKRVATDPLHGSGGRHEIPGLSYSVNALDLKERLALLVINQGRRSVRPAEGESMSKGPSSGQVDDVDLPGECGHVRDA